MVSHHDSSHHPSSHHGLLTTPCEQKPGIPNRPARGVPFYTPAQIPPAGTASDPQPDGRPLPKLFTPFTLRGITFQNRIGLSPLCQYSAEDGHLTPWHFAHLGGIISRGPGLAMVEATSVTAEGRITPEDSGLWKDSQIEPLRRIVEFAHSQGQKIGISLHTPAGKPVQLRPGFLTALLQLQMYVPIDVNGWPENVYGPSAIAYNDDHAFPNAMTLQDITHLKQAWIAAVKRALKAGFDVIEIHVAHGYLLHNFLSPASNTRDDMYGGSFENRTRLVLEIVDLTRRYIPDDMPLFLRLSATDWLDYDGSPVKESWTLADSVRLAPLLAERGVDLLDVSSAGNHPAQKISTGSGYQAPFAKEIKKVVGDTLAVSAVGTITSGKQAEELLEDGGLDFIFAGRMFQKNPGLVWTWAEELGVEINVANQIRWGFGGRPGAKKE